MDSDDGAIVGADAADVVLHDGHLVVEGAVDGIGNDPVDVLPDNAAPGRGDTPSGLDWGGFDVGGALVDDPVYIRQGCA